MSQKPTPTNQKPTSTPRPRTDGQFEGMDGQFEDGQGGGRRVENAPLELGGPELSQNRKELSQNRREPRRSRREPRRSRCEPRRSPEAAQVSETPEKEICEKDMCERDGQEADELDATMDNIEPWRHPLTELGDARRLKDGFGANARWVLEKKSFLIYQNSRWVWDEHAVLVSQAARRLADFLSATLAAENRTERRDTMQLSRLAAEMQAAAPPGLRVTHSPSRSGKNSPNLNPLGIAISPDLNSPDLNSPDMLNSPDILNESCAPERRGRAAWVRKCQSLRHLKNIVELLRGEPGIPLSLRGLDADPLLLGVQNGVVDLQTGALRPDSRADYITRTAAAAFDPDAPAPTWERYLEAVQPDPAMRDFLARAVGYSLTALTTEQCFFVLHGDGATGKTTFLETLRFLLGDYAVGLPMSSLLVSPFGAGLPNDIARLSGARLTLAQETNACQRFDAALCKRLSGGDTLTARFLHGEFFDFAPTHKLWLATNHLPQVTDASNAFWRRLMLIPFDVVFAGDAVDPNLPAKLRAEAAGILAWAVRGCLEWQRRGLAPPTRLVAGAGAYQAEQDIVGAFVRERCDVGPGKSHPARPLYEDFRRWASARGEIATTETAFGLSLNRLGHASQRDRHGSRRRGLTLRTACAAGVEDEIEDTTD